VSQPRPLTASTGTAITIGGVRIPDSKLAQEITELVRDAESPPLFHHSSRVFYWGALTGARRGLMVDAELLYARAMFHDMGLTPQYGSANERFEVDGANAARDFLRGNAISQRASTRSGRQSPCTRRRAFRSTCTRWSHW
jgi:HD superfamily phosphodiesterase